MVTPYLVFSKQCEEAMDFYDTQFTFADEFSKLVTPGSLVYLTINPSSLDEGTKVYDELKENGEVLLPATETFYSPLHATVKDKFGIMWNIIMINI